MGLPSPEAARAAAAGNRRGRAAAGDCAGAGGAIRAGPVWKRWQGRRRAVASRRRAVGVLAAAADIAELGVGVGWAEAGRELEKRRLAEGAVRGPGVREGEERG